MQQAYAPDSDHLYDAADVEALAYQPRQALLTDLRCPGCGARVFFRRTAVNGRRACFFATAHARGCDHAVAGGGGGGGRYDAVRRDADRVQAIAAGDGVISLHAGRLPSTDPADGDQTGPAPTGSAPPAPPRDGNSRGESTGSSNRVLRALLHCLMESPEFADSDARIETRPGTRWYARNLIVGFDEAEPDEQRPHIYWGRLVSTDPYCKWLNSGGPDEASIDVIALHREPGWWLGLADPGFEVPGAMAIVFGWCIAGRRGKPIIRPLKPRDRNIVVRPETATDRA